MPEAARILDQVTHTSALAGLIVGAVAGAVIGALVVTSGGTAAVALGALAVAAGGGASLGGMIGQLAGSLATFKTGPIVAPGALTVLIDYRCAARVTDLVACTGMPFSPIPHPGVPIAQGSTTVMIGGLPAARKGDMVGCGSQISEGSATVLIGGPTGTYLPIDSEVPWYLEVGLFALGLASGIGAIALAKTGMRVLMSARLVGSLIGGWGMATGGKWLGGKLFGEGSTGQKIFTLAGGIGGSMLGGSLVGRFYPGTVAEPLIAPTENVEPPLMEPVSEDTKPVFGNSSMEPAAVEESPPPSRPRVNRMQPDPEAEGPHSTFVRDPQTQKVYKYQQWDENGMPVQRADIGSNSSDPDPHTHHPVGPDHMHTYTAPNRAPDGTLYPGNENKIGRNLEPDEIPQ